MGMPVENMAAGLEQLRLTPEVKRLLRRAEKQAVFKCAMEGHALLDVGVLGRVCVRCTKAEREILTDDKLVEMLIGHNQSWIRVNEEWKDLPLAIPAPLKSHVRRWDALWEEALERGLEFRINNEENVQVSKKTDLSDIVLRIEAAVVRGRRESAILESKKEKER